MIFAFMPLTEDSVVTAFKLPDRLDNPEVSWFSNYAEWNSPWRFYMDNVLDPMHGAFLHRDSHSMFGGDTSAPFPYPRDRSWILLRENGPAWQEF